MRTSKIYLINDNDFVEIIKKNSNYSDILRELKLTPRGGSSLKILKKRIEELNIDTSHFISKTEKAHRKRTTKLENILIENSKYTCIHVLKKRLIKEKIIEYKCAVCGNEGLWQNKSLSLQLDHINGKNNNHRIANLRFICPNCHSQTDTYAGKNISKAKI